MNEPRNVINRADKGPKNESAVWGLLAGCWFSAIIGLSACADYGPVPAPDAVPETPPAPIDLPTVISFGGPVLAAPRAQAIYFPGFAYESQVDSFLASLQTSTYWPAVAAEYGVGPLKMAPSHVSSVSAPPTIAEQDIRILFDQVMTTDATGLGGPSGDTIYTLFFPATTTITTRSGVAFCQPTSPRGFHFESAVSGTRVAVAVIASCASLDGLNGVSALTPVISHELVEAATDPFTSSAPAFANTDAEHAFWSVGIGGGEVGDLCENEQPNLITPSDLGFPVQRMWSNAAVGAGTGPCVPVPPGEVFFVGVPDLPDRVQVQRNGTAFSVPALSTTVGTNATVDVTFRNQAGLRTPWAVAVWERHADNDSLPKLSLTAGIQGQHSAVGVIPNEMSAGIFPLVVISMTRADPPEMHLWIGAVQRR